MAKLVISNDEVASVAEALPAPFTEARLTSPLSKTSRVLLSPLVLVLPALCIATTIIWLACRHKEPRVLHAWMHFCCALLVISGVLSSVLVGFVLFSLAAPAPRPAAPFVLDTPIELPATETANLLSPRELAGRVEDSVYIVSRDSKWLKPTREALSISGFGTGVLLFAGENEFLFATSRHVLDGESWKRSSPYRGDAVLWDRKGGFSRAQIVGRHKDLDLMLLRMPRIEGSSRFVQPILDFAQIAPGERIMIFGHPEGLFFSLADGLVSRKEPSGLVQITAPVSPGASGGPVYDMRGRLLAIISSMVDKQLSPHAENLNFAVRADSLLHADQWQMESSGQKALEEFIATTATPPATPEAQPAPSSTHP